MNGAGKVTLAHVAEAAGVSVPTVSKALNGRGQLNDATRHRIVEIADRLGFRPNQAARSLTSGRTYLVGVITTDSYGRFTLPILSGAEDTLGLGEISMVLCESRGDAIREQYYVNSLVSRAVDGVIVTGRFSNARPSITPRFRVPVVYALSPSEDPADMSVVPDDVAGTVRGIEHLVHTGKRSIAVIGGPRHHVASDHRTTGALARITALGARVAGEPLFGEWSERWGYEATSRLLATEEFDGVFCASDQIARGALDRLREAGVSVPGAVGVLGVDNWDVIALAARPSLTSIDLNLRGVGQRAAARLLQAIDTGVVTGGVELVDCALVAREST